MSGPAPDTLAPVEGHPRVVFLRPLAEGRANVEVGDYAYYDDPAGERAFFEKNVLHHYDFVGDKLSIGRFAMIAADVKIMMNGATHAMSGFSAYPFNIFGSGWEEGFDPATWEAENKGDTIIGADVWIGTEAMILPGARIGPGSIIGARSVVSGRWPSYSVIAGDPARQVRRRFPDAVCDALERIAWWDWPAHKIGRNLNAIRGADVAALEQAT